MRLVRLSISQSLESDAATKERLGDLSRATGGSIQQWNAGDILSWINKHLLALIDPNVTLAALDRDHDSYKAIKDRKLAEDQRSACASIC